MDISLHLSRRGLLQVGALSLAGSLASQVGAKDQGAKQRSCIYILLQGGLSHHETWDPKPDASPEIRGPFGTIETKLGVRFGEIVPHTAQIADRLCVVRSMNHQFNNHIAGTYIAMTGSPNQQNNDREAHADDFPGPGAILNALEKSTPSVPRSVSLPNWLSIPGPSNRMPGQYGGFLGSVHDPFLIEGDPNQADYRPLSLELPDSLDTKRLRTRLNLASQLDSAARLLEAELSARHDRLTQSAFDLVADGRVRKALDLSEEPASLRNRYGRTKFGQSLLIARRLVEAGVQFVAYNAFNQEWDTHGDLERRYKQIAPPMDQAFAALVDDLDQKGLLDSTLVINTGEFGRTPRINKDAGRDHWPNAYSTVLAGGGLKRGYIHGQTDNHGAEAISQPVSPADILATMWHQLGIAPSTEIYDRLNRPHRISDGRVIKDLLA